MPATGVQQNANIVQPHVQMKKMQLYWHSVLSLIAIVLICAELLLHLWQGQTNIQSALQISFAIYVQKFVPPVQRNVKNIHTWSIAKNVQKHVAIVRRSAATLAKCNQLKISFAKSTLRDSEKAKCYLTVMQN